MSTSSFKFTSFNGKDFWEAIEKKDYTSLKINTVSSMLNDPTFARGKTDERGEADEVLEILDERVPEIFEEEVKLDYEERLDRSAWDKRYFTKLTYWFQENFAKSRVDYIKEVGRAVHQDTAQKYNESMNRRPAQSASSIQAGRRQGGYGVNPTQAPDAKTKKLPIPGIIAAVVVLVLLGVTLLMKLLPE